MAAAPPAALPLKGEEFGQLVAGAVQSEIGWEALDHAKVAGCRRDGPRLEACGRIGFEPQGPRDCTSLFECAIMRAVHAAQDGTPATAGLDWWPETLRHVRDIEALARPASFESIRSGLITLIPGNGVIFLRDRLYSDGTLHRLPGHIAVVTEVIASDQYKLVQTKSSEGKVVRTDWQVGERPEVRTPYGVIPAAELATAALQQMNNTVI